MYIYIYNTKRNKNCLCKEGKKRLMPFGRNNNNLKILWNTCRPVLLSR